MVSRRKPLWPYDYKQHLAIADGVFNNAWKVAACFNVLHVQEDLPITEPVLHLAQQSSNVASLVTPVADKDLSHGCVVVARLTRLGLEILCADVAYDMNEEFSSHYLSSQPVRYGIIFHQQQENSMPSSRQVHGPGRGRVLQRTTATAVG